MDQDGLTKAYSAEEFRRLGHEMIDQLADHLQNSLNRQSAKVIDWCVPEDEHAYWHSYMAKGDPDQIAQQIIERCIHIHHPRYMGHQISPAAPITGLTSLLSSFLNNGMGIYEMGAAPTAMERVVTDILCQTVGFEDKGSGFLTSGGTLANLTALLSARQNYIRKNKLDIENPGKLGVMVSEEAHYCIDRAVRIMGMGNKGIIKIPVDKDFRIRTEKLNDYFSKARDKGIQIFAIVGSAPSTATGMYDDLDTLAGFAKQNDIWFHIDGAHGGAAIFSTRYKHLLKGINNADSVVIDGHKMMMMPGITTALLFREGENSHLTFKQKADYLLEESIEEDWYNLAKRTFECTKYMMSLHWYTLLKIYGAELFDNFVTRLYDLAREFAEIILADPDFELAVKPMSNILCFRYIKNNSSGRGLNQVNKDLRQKILEDGSYYIVQTKLKNKQYLRTTIMNPFTTAQDFQALLTKIKSFA